MLTRGQALRLPGQSPDWGTPVADFGPNIHPMSLHSRPFFFVAALRSVARAVASKGLLGVCNGDASCDTSPPRFLGLRAPGLGVHPARVQQAPTS